MGTWHHVERKKEHTDEITDMRGDGHEHKCESAQMRAADAEAYERPEGRGVRL